MEMTIKNVGKIYNKVSVSVNGITILAGMNGSGKSTIGKALYCVYKGLHDCENQIAEERKTSIYRIIRTTSGHGKRRHYISPAIKEKFENLIEMAEADNTSEEIRQELVNAIGEYSEVDEEMVEKVKEILTFSDDEILNALLDKWLEAEFDSQVGHLNYPEESSEIIVRIKDADIVIRIDNGRANIESKIELKKDIIYLDDPYVIDDLSPIFLGEHTHRLDVIDKLRKKSTSELSVIEGMIVNERLKDLYEKLDIVSAGTIEYDDNEYGYRDKKLKKQLSIKNLSTGMKSFAIIKDLLNKGYLEENGIVILDEPEAHLHPEWMLTYAEIVVLLQKELRINFLISTHSSEFISYLELYTKKYAVSDKCNWYLLKENAENSSVTDLKDCSDDINLIYDELTRPYIWASRELDAE